MKIALFHKNSYICTFSLITLQTALGAAHCLRNTDVRDLYGTIGNGNKMLGEKISFSAMYKHPFLKPSGFHDIATLILRKPIDKQQIPNVSPIALPLRDREFTKGTATVTGWGRKDSESQSDILQMAEVELIDPEPWIHVYPQLDKSQIAVIAEGVILYPGDSGGPLTYVTEEGYQVIIGVLSYSLSNATIPHIFCSTGKHLEWIKVYTVGKLTFRDVC
ncbi:transmembrane protease serine 4-like [Centruroides vittatus]|uniref:transmembrane protease serine 4-like n=1 Tax=Centruroides vittatus TaxID=120091 RepID=UPI003510C965